MSLLDHVIWFTFVLNVTLTLCRHVLLFPLSPLRAVIVKSLINPNHQCHQWYFVTPPPSCVIILPHKFQYQTEEVFQPWSFIIFFFFTQSNMQNAQTHFCNVFPAMIISMFLTILHCLCHFKMFITDFLLLNSTTLTRFKHWSQRSLIKLIQMLLPNKVKAMFLFHSRTKFKFKTYKGLLALQYVNPDEKFIHSVVCLFRCFQSLPVKLFLAGPKVGKRGRKTHDQNLNSSGLCFKVPGLHAVR